MNQKKHLFSFVIAISISFILIAVAIFAKDYDFLPIDPVKVSRYDVDRIVYQRVEKFTDYLKDSSCESLLIIKNKKIYFLLDGYDNIYDVLRKHHIMSISNKFEELDAAWPNKINGKPDFLQIMERRSTLMMNNNEEFVSTNFGSFYKAIRNKFIKEHIDKYHQLLRKRAEAEIVINRKPIRSALYDEVSATAPQKYSTVVKVKALDDTVYSCEDYDGDGVTETFIVNAADGFNWGYKSGGNLIFIYRNTDKDIEALIGKLANEAVFGSVDDEKEMIEMFPKEKDISDLIKFVTPMEPNYSK